jgi:hypothetical protein
MPYKMRKIRNKNLYYVYNIETNHKFSYGSTYENAKKQKKLLELKEHGFIK